MLLHGWPQTGLAWEGVLPDLGQDFYALAFDLPGVGDSEGAPQSSEKTAIANVILSAAEPASGKRTIVAGYDIGGMPWSTTIADPRIWHFAFHAVPDLPELLVASHECAYFDFFYNLMAGDPRYASGEPS